MCNAHAGRPTLLPAPNLDEAPRVLPRVRAGRNFVARPDAPRRILRREPVAEPKRSSSTVVVVAVVLAVLACACLCAGGFVLLFGAASLPVARDSTSAGRDGLQYGSADDVERILTDHGVTPGPLACRNLLLGGGVTRGVSCVTRMSSSDVSLLAGSLGLSSETPSAASAMESDGCRTRADFSATAPGVELWSVHGRPSTAPGMEYIAIYTSPTTGETCIETQYAWS